MARRLAGIAAVAIAVLLFLVANRGAYEGYFSGDDLDNIAWLRLTGMGTFVAGLLTPQYYPDHFRPVGHGTLAALAALAGLRFPAYVAVLQALHLAATGLLLLVLREFGLSPLRAALGALFFVFHMTLFDAIWKPMYVFDVWCGLFGAACLLAWIRRRWVWSLVLFWFAYKSKEHAVMLPAAIAVYEYWLGKRRWLPLAPMAALAAAFSLQAALANKVQGDAYTLQFTLPALAKTVSFYGSRVMLPPWLGVALLAAAAVARDKRVWFGLVAALLLVAPLLALPGRMFPAYLYLGMVAVSVAVGVLLARLPAAAACLLILVWLAVNFARMRHERRAELTLAQENRAYVAQLFEHAARLPDVRRFVYDGYPANLPWWGIAGALKWHYGVAEVEIRPVEEANLSRTFAEGSVALLSWDAGLRKLYVVSRAGSRDEPYIRVSRQMPVWQLADGWYQTEGRFRWTRPRAAARLWRPAGAKTFEVEVNVGPAYIASVKESALHVLIDGREAGVARFNAQGWQKRQFAIPAAPEGPVAVEFFTEPAYTTGKDDPRPLGSAIAGFGFVP